MYIYLTLFYYSMSNEKRKSLKRGQSEFGVGMLIAGILFVAFIAVTIIFGLFYTIDAGERGIVRTFGEISPSISQPGLHVKIPIFQSVIKYSIRAQTISFDNKQGTGDGSEYSSLFASSKDLQSTQTAIVCNFHINEENVIDIYKKYGTSDNYHKNIIEPIIRDTVKAVSAQYTAEELVTKRPEVAEAVTKLLSQRFYDKNAVLDNINIVNFEFSKEYAAAIEQKVVQAQLLEKSKIELETIKVQAQQRIEQARGEAEAIKIQAQSINQQGGQNYVELQRINRWDGHYPLFMGSGTSAILDMRSISASTISYTSSTNVTQ
jgi:regulator of protease activity HflC (stomatin/prohibitin superfamily)